MRRQLVVLILQVCFFALAQTASADNWPGWRGDGSGVSTERDLPVEWGPDRNIRWKTRIEGDGISSPIVWGDRVFVTTAIEGSEAVVSRWGVGGIAGGLSLFAFVSYALRRKGRDDDDVPSPTPQLWLRRLHGLDRLAGLVLATLFLSGMVMIVTLEQFTPTIPGLGTIRLIERGHPAKSWLVSGGITTLGLAAALCFVGPRSAWRLLGAVGLLTAAVLFHEVAPLNQHTKPMKLRQLILVSGTLSAVAGWCVVMFVASRRLRAPRIVATGHAFRALIGPAALASAAVLVFVFANYLQPQKGLQRCVVCLDRDTGEILWRADGFMAPPLRRYKFSSYATPTPTTDGRHVVAYYGPGLFCVDFDGEVLWRRMVPEYAEALRYGAASSPVIFDDGVIYAFMAEWPGGISAQDMNFSYGESSYLAALETRTGKELWRCTPPGAHDTYDTPLIVDDGDRPTLLLSTWEYVLAYDLESGEQRWRCDVPIQQGVPSLVADRETVYAAGGTEELKCVIAIRRGGQGDVTDSHVNWTVTKRTPEDPSPLLVEGLLYWITDQGIAICVEAATGEEVWKKRIDGHFLASPVAADGRIYFPEESGDTIVIQAGREFKQLARNGIGQECRASPAISNGMIFIRGVEHLFCIAADKR